MPAHVVGFHDCIEYEDIPNQGRVPVFRGRELLWAVYHKADYKNIQPGDRLSIYPFRENEFVDFVAPTPFVADLKICDENHYAGSTVTLYNELNNTYYPMFTSDFMAMVRAAVLTRGHVTGRFGFVKKNINFGIVYLGEKEENV
jgi:hypothetical protein